MKTYENAIPCMTLVLKKNVFFLWVKNTIATMIDGMFPVILMTHEEGIPTFQHAF